MGSRKKPLLIPYFYRSTKYLRSLVFVLYKGLSLYFGSLQLESNSHCLSKPSIWGTKEKILELVFQIRVVFFPFPDDQAVVWVFNTNTQEAEIGGSL